MANVDLLRLIDLSLGKEPCGVVNFNYMHSLMHEIVRRLGHIEEMNGGDLKAVAMGELKSKAFGSPEKLLDKLDEEVHEPGVPAKVDPSSVQAVPQDVKEAVGDDTESTESLLTHSTPAVSLAKRSSRVLRPRTSIITAANDLGALERKLSTLETRMDAVESLSELLDKRASNSSATPVNDMWNFIQINKRLDATEQGLQKTASLVDELLGEFNAWKDDLPKLDALKESLDSLRQEVVQNNGSIKKLEEMIQLLENIQPGEGLLSSLSDLRARMDSLQAETDALKEDVNEQNQQTKELVTWKDLEEALKAHQRPKTPIPLKHPSPEALEALNKIGSLSEELDAFVQKMNAFEAELAKKLDADMLPKGDDGLESLMPMILEMQSKLAFIESEMSGKQGVSPETLEKISTMQQAIDSLSAEVSGMLNQVAGSGRVEELGGQVAQMRERLSEVDRAVNALASAVAAVSDMPRTEATPQVELDSFMELQGLVGDMKQHQDRLLDTAAHLSNELSVNQEHLKKLYGNVHDLEEMKADKETVQVEVEEKADRKALEAKASRQWVESTFEKLDREIREAKSVLEAQDEALRGTVDRITADVDSKLDRDEMEMLRDYIDKKLKDAKQPIIHQNIEPEGDDAAGFKKPMKVRCISCDKPIGMKTGQNAPLSLPQGQVMPPQKTFRPYTTYELELIRQHQRGFGSVVQNYSSGYRSAGGNHTLTHPHRRMRVAPLNTQYADDSHQPIHV
jgi:predicted  nucleic acid-binding Zn-ribbon protein